MQLHVFRYIFGTILSDQDMLRVKVVRTLFMDESGGGVVGYRTPRSGAETNQGFSVMIG